MIGLHHLIVPFSSVFASGFTIANLFLCTPWIVLFYVSILHFVVVVAVEQVAAPAAELSCPSCEMPGRSVLLSAASITLKP